MPDIIIYPNGKTGGNLKPNIEFSDGTTVQLTMSGTSLVYSAATNQHTVVIDTTTSTVTSLGAKGSTGLWVGGVKMIDSSGIWVGPKAGISGATGSQGTTGATGSQGATGAQGAQGAQGPAGSDSTVPGAQGAQGAPGAPGSQGSSGIANITLTQTSYSCPYPMSASGSAITVNSDSNGYGTRYVRTYTPTGEGCDGDVWYQIT